MASLQANLDGIIAALDDIDSKPNIWNKQKVYDALKEEFVPRRKALNALIEAATPDSVSDVNGVIKDGNGKTLGHVVDGVVVLVGA